MIKTSKSIYLAVVFALSAIATAFSSAFSIATETAVSYMSQAFQYAAKPLEFLFSTAIRSFCKLFELPAIRSFMRRMSWRSQIPLGNLA